jgi:hypothetical protein
MDPPVDVRVVGENTAASGIVHIATAIKVAILAFMTISNFRN